MSSIELRLIVDYQHDFALHCCLLDEFVRRRRLGQPHPLSLPRSIIQASVIASKELVDNWPYGGIIGAVCVIFETRGVNE